MPHPCCHALDYDEVLVLREKDEPSHTKTSKETNLGWQTPPTDGSFRSHTQLDG